jgi:hypothetical protein
MSLNRIAALGACVGLAAGVAVAVAGTPFGGDDTGTIPSSKTALKCEDGIGTAVGKAVGCIGKCTAAEADGKIMGDAAEDACEKSNGGKSCLEKFTASAMKFQTKAAGACNCVNVGSLSGIIEADLDMMNNAVYCDTSSGIPFGGDDTGDLPPPKTAIQKCEDGVNKLVGKAAACIIKCHKGEADGKIVGDAAEDACEKSNGGKSCIEKFTAGAAKFTGCPSCLNVTALATTIENVLDTGNALTYCASPSGAFVE